MGGGIFALTIPLLYFFISRPYISSVVLVLGKSLLFGFLSFYEDGNLTLG